MKIGVLSDTHDLLRREVVEYLHSCDHILHAGDVSSPGILEELRKIAPIVVVRGNADEGWGEELPLVEEITLDGLHFGTYRGIKGVDPAFHHGRDRL